MPTKLELTLEAERRGILPPEKRRLLNEARKRGLIDAPPQTEARSTDSRYSALGPLAPVARGAEDLANLAGDPFGVRDEIVGGGAFVRGLVTSGGDLDEAGKAYTEASERARGERKAARDTYGIVPEIVGGLGTSALARGFRMAPTLAGRVMQSGRAGAGYGAAAGAGHSEGGVRERLEGTAIGAGTGAAFGPLVTEVAAPAIGGLVRGARATGRGLGNAARFVRSRNANVDARLNRALRDQNMTPQQAEQAINEAQGAARFGRTQTNPQHTLADLGPSTRDLADTSALVSREARGEAGQFLQERARGQFRRINDYLRRTLQVTRENFARRQTGLVNEQRALSRNAYDQAYANTGEFDVGQVLFNRQFDEFAAAGPLARALRRARSLFVDGGRAPGLQASLNTQRFDSGKRALDDMIQSARNGGRNNEARLLTQLKNELLDVADVANPAYRAARDVYSSRAELLEAMDAGRTFMRGDSEMTGQAYRALSTGERRMFRIGLAQQVRRDLGRKRVGTDMVGYFERPNVREVLEEIMSPAQAQRFYQLVELEQGLAATNQAVRGNSRTTERQQNVLDFSLGVRLGRAIKDQGLRAAISNEVFDQVTRFFAMREADAVALTRMLFETDPAIQRQIVQRLSQTYGTSQARAIVNRAQRIARQRMAHTRRSLAGVTGELAGKASAQRATPHQMQLRSAAP